MKQTYVLEVDGNPEMAREKDYAAAANWIKGAAIWVEGNPGWHAQSPRDKQRYRSKRRGGLTVSRWLNTPPMTRTFTSSCWMLTGWR